MGSVKDLETVQKPTKNAMGIGRFHFSDRYSIFDWGEMPDHIRHKGAALCLMGAYCFEKLEEEYVKTHYRGLITQEGKLVRFKELEQPTNIMEFDLVNLVRPKTYLRNGKVKYDYSMFTTLLKNYLIPLEIIYRNGLPQGSSLLRRLEEGSVTIQQLGLDHYPKPGENLTTPIFDVSTKLEEKDRYVTWDEAQKIAGLTQEETEEIKNVLFKVDKKITKIASGAGLANEDGKIELAFDQERRLMVADVVGTLDECRFTLDSLHISKEIARIHYRRTSWYKDVENAKKRAEREGVEDWRTLCSSDPSKLDPFLKGLIGEIYMSAANELTHIRLFDAPEFKKVVKKYMEYAGSS